MSLTFPLWRGFLDHPIFIICHRDPAEVALSLRNRDGIPVNVGAALWDAYALSALRSTRDVPRIFVDYHALLAHPADFVAGLLAQINGNSDTLQLDRSAIDTIVRVVGEPLDTRIPLSRLDDLLDIVRSGTTSHDEIRELVQSTLESVTNLATEMPSVRADMSAVMEGQHQLQSDLVARSDTLKAQIRELQASRTEIATKLERKESELASMKQQYYTLERRNTALRVQLAEFDRRNTALADDLATTHERLQALGTLIGDARTERAAAVAAKRRMRSEIDELRTRVTCAGEHADAALMILLEHMDRIERGFADGGTPSQIVAAVRYCIAEAVNRLRYQLDEQDARDLRYNASG